MDFISPSIANPDQKEYYEKKDAPFLRASS
jgi:hypothetical protein